MQLSTFADRVYNLLPEVYREEDSYYRYQLQRYLQSCMHGGFGEVLKDIDNFLKLGDPDLCPDKFFPYLYESFGLEYTEDIDISYQRKFLSNVGELNSRRGTYGAVRFLVRVLTGYEVELSYLRGEYLGVQGRWLFIDLLADSLEDFAHMDVAKSVVAKFVQGQLPFYLTPIIGAKISAKTILLETNRGNFISYFKSYELDQE